MSDVSLICFNDVLKIISIYSSLGLKIQYHHQDLDLQSLQHHHQIYLIVDGGHSPIILAINKNGFFHTA